MTEVIKEFEKNFKVINKGKGDIEKSLAYGLDKLIDFLGAITEYKRSELFAISLFHAEDKYLSHMVSEYRKEKKHVKRKFSKEIQKFGDSLTKAIAKEYNMNKIASIFRGRNNRDDYF